ncbi:amidase signature enzyme [Guyanagaster necrorhizus]|uniref:amidase n=1 Tax=Guyanagaster necrorhizus TaxID=856835 RepID=A0A9P7VW10_9AGAR|nr:amidase signature enzyme [Guyanagaster necrorhizus MCA 3950]KAG7448378.1 amidase signature enzyme [Guyanagaster necrorhizus MCA 3950]
MALFFSHWKACRVKQEERKKRIKDLDPIYHEPLSKYDVEILRRPIADLIASVQSGACDPSDILVAYSKQALKAHATTNCLSEIMIASAATWAKQCNRKGPLAGVLVSLKDLVGVKGWDSTIGYSAWVGHPIKEDAPLIRLLRDAGAVPFVKTTIPITLLSFESSSDLFGRTTNPHNPAYSPGGSSGGEAALLAYGGSRIGIGTDVAGSVRTPSHYSGVYTIRSSTTRFPKVGGATSIPGQEGVAAVCSPMARTLADLETFWKAVVSQKPWDYDYTCMNLPWRDVDLSKKNLKWGVMWDDGVVLPSPACKRALHSVVETLQNHGHEVFMVPAPSPYEGLKIASQLLLADGGKTVMQPFQLGETNDPGVRQARIMFALPHWIRRLYVWYLRYLRGDEVYAGLVEGCYEKNITEYWPLVAQREAYRRQWFDMWNEYDLDFLLTVPNALPAVPHGGMKEGFKSCGYTFLFNLLDYSAGVLPVTHVNAKLDVLKGFKARNAVEAGAYQDYDSVEMDGLPVGVQVVGKRFEEEKVMEGMKLIEILLKEDGKVYNLLNT